VGTTDEATGRLEALLERLHAGDESAKDEVIWHSCERLMSLASKMMRRYRRLHRWEELDDVFQDAMLRLHRSLSDVKPESVRQFFGLAATQIRRTLIDMARRHYGPEGPGTYGHVDIGQAEAATTNGPANLHQWTEFYEVLDTLPEEERAVVDLLWFEGLTQAEAALALGASERTVRRRWYAARYLLYKALSHEW
jgi:RNA polymerase sigma factor (sigma-70 family)